MEIEMQTHKCHTASCFPPSETHICISLDLKRVGLDVLIKEITLVKIIGKI